MTQRTVVGVVVWMAAIGWMSSALLADEFSDQRLANWHQWRGPIATGVAPLGDPPTNWDESTNIKWKVAIPGRGTSTPVVWGNRIFILTAIKTDRVREEASAGTASDGQVRPAAFTENGEAAPQSPQPPQEGRPAAGERDNSGRGEGRGRGPGRGGFRFGGGEPPTNYHQFVVLCLDRHTGRTMWEKVACEAVPHEGHHGTASFAPASPVTDGRRVYCSFGSRGIYCYDMNGNQQWSAPLTEMRIKMGFGEGSSPALHGDTLIVNCDHEGDSFIVALDAASGREKWRIPRDEETTWNTPLIAEHDGRAQVVVSGTKRVRSYDLATGELLWECGGQTDNVIPSPMQLDDLAICISGFRSYAAYAIPLDATGDVTDTDQIAWRHNEGTPYVSSAALVGERLYFTKDRAAILTCLNARTGDVIIDQKRLPALDDLYASPVAAAGRLYVTSRNGATVVLDATADEVNVLAENQLDETIDASPAIVGREIFVRGDKSLYCIAEQ